jgi:hypothetical protein
LTGRARRHVGTGQAGRQVMLADTGRFVLGEQCGLSGGGGWCLVAARH